MVEVALLRLSDLSRCLDVVGLRAWVFRVFCGSCAPNSGEFGYGGAAIPAGSGCRVGRGPGVSLAQPPTPNPQLRVGMLSASVGVGVAWQIVSTIPVYCYP
jgi:hypothetical protein